MVSFWMGCVADSAPAGWPGTRPELSSTLEWVAALTASGPLSDRAVWAPDGPTSTRKLPSRCLTSCERSVHHDLDTGRRHGAAVAETASGPICSHHGIAVT